jgi:hypothetical protein
MVALFVAVIGGAVEVASWGGIKRSTLDMLLCNSRTGNSESIGEKRRGRIAAGHEPPGLSKP